METYDGAYRAGQVLGVLLFLSGGGLLLWSGIRAQRQARFELEDSRSRRVAKGPDDPWAALGELAQVSPRRQGIKRMVFGGLLLLMGSLATLGALLPERGASAARPSTPRTPMTTTDVSLPPLLLGIKRDDELIRAERKEFMDSLPPQATQADMGYYPTDRGGYLLQVFRAEIAAPALQLRQVQRELSAEYGPSVGAPTVVPAGPLGGQGHCWTIAAALVDRTDPAYLCYFIDDAAAVYVLDFEAKGLQPAAARGRQIRCLVERRTTLGGPTPTGAPACR